MNQREKRTYRHGQFHVKTKYLIRSAHKLPEHINKVRESILDTSPNQHNQIDPAPLSESRTRLPT